MKKALSILLLLLYTTTSFGFSVNEFYCCEQPGTVTFSIQQDVNKKYSKHSKKERCCENQFNNLQVKDTHILSGQSGCQVKHLSNLFLSACGNYYRTPVFTTIERESINSPAHAPPIHGEVPIYIFNCTYRI